MKAILRTPLFSHGFRPFFLAAGVFALLAVPAWLWMYDAGMSPLAPLPGRLWHGHEMVFGFTHGIGWFFMVALSLYGLRTRLIDLRLALAIAVLGAVGPYFGTAEFIHQDRVRARRRDAAGASAREAAGSVPAP